MKNELKLTNRQKNLLFLIQKNLNFYDTNFHRYQSEKIDAFVREFEILPFFIGITNGNIKLTINMHNSSV